MRVDYFQGEQAVEPPLMMLPSHFSGLVIALKAGILYIDGMVRKCTSCHFPWLRYLNRRYLERYFYRICLEKKKTKLSKEYTELLTFGHEW